jgi:hypothetical protein
MNTPALRNVKLRQGLDLTIKECAFYNSGLVKLGNEYSGMDIVNNNITLDGEFIFSYMPNLTEVDFSSIAEDEVIPKGTFYHDLNLEKVVLDHTVQSVGPLAFASDPKLETFVMYGPTEIANKTPVKSVEVDGYNNYILLLNTEEDFTLTITDEVNGETIITSADFTNNKYTYQTNTTEAIPITIETTDNIFLDTMYGKNISITDIDDDVMTIPSTANLYCYSTHEECITYYENYKEYRDAAETDLYFLDEVIYLGSNKDHLDASDVNTGLLTDGLVVYALRRDGVILVSEEWQSLTDSAIFSDSGITMLSYDSSTTDPSKMVFHTTIPIEDVDVETNNNFENLEYVAEQDEETGEIIINFQYQNLVTENQTEAEVRDNKPDMFRVVYADGCGGESFANIIYIDLPLNSDTPVFEGAPTREGYEFIGWDQEIDSKVTKNVIYKALWKKIEKIYPDPSENPNGNIDINNPLTINAKILLSLILLAFTFMVYTFTRNKKYKKVLNH